MLGTARYLVRGKANLQALAGEKNIFSVLTDPFLVRGHIGHGSRHDYELGAKIFVLLNFIKEYAADPEIGTFLRSAPPTGQFFDQWWELTRAEDEEYMPWFGETFRAENITRSQIPPTDNEFVEDWLNRVVAF
jgi:hypothetical protein